MYLDLPTPNDLVRLADTRADACVSIFVPTTPLTQNIGAAQLTLKNLAKEAETQLTNASFDKRRLQMIVEHIADLLDDDDFWAHQATSLAVFVTPDGISTYRLPTHLQDRVEVSNRFHITPLFRSQAFPDVALVLALAENSVRVIEMPGEGPGAELRIPHLPKDMDHAGARSKSRNVAPGGRFEGAKGELFHRRTYARKIDAALRPIMAGRDVPLILACVAEFETIYRSVNTYSHLAPTAVRGNAEHMTVSEITEAARPILRSLHTAQIAHWTGLCQERAKDGRSATDVSEIARAAVAGAVDVLLLDIDATLHGTVDEETGALQVTDGSSATTYDVADQIAATVVRKGGRVIGLRKADMPQPNSPLAAIYRFVPGA